MLVGIDSSIAAGNAGLFNAGWENFLSGFSDVVILIPGIIGSELSKDGRVLWGGSESTIWGALTEDTLDALALSAPGSLDEDIGDGITATGILRRPAVIPDLWKIGTYQDLSRGLIEGLRLSPGKNYFEFAYDWRRDNRVAAGQLARAAHSWLSVWKASSGNDGARLVLVTHSMGGLIARHFVEVMEGWRTTRATFAISTPFSGSGNAVSFLADGMTQWWLPQRLKDSINAIRGMDSVYQLLPTTTFIKDTDGGLHHVHDSSIANIDAGRARAALDFHAEMTGAANSNASIDAYASRRGSLRTVIGTEQPTFGFAALQSTGVVTCENSDDDRLLWGDGIVPRRSATPPEVGEEVATFVPTRHAVIPSHAMTIAHIRNAIAGLPEVSLRDRGGVGTISLTIGDIYPAREPVRMTAATGTPTQYLDLSITGLDQSAIRFTTRMYPKDGMFTWEGALEPGSYASAVSCAGAETAGDVFFVQSVQQE
ncbi:hypothetical protein ACI3KW_12190 [Devosia sp. ZW T5_3]|uniref:lipase/acyltransferase domain-containing protein n=1 Tax=Devosia sp. ZW T5_3 TaxID=3378085 RepID=UPI0038532932